MKSVLIILVITMSVGIFLALINSSHQGKRVYVEEKSFLEPIISPMVSPSPIQQQEAFVNFQDTDVETIVREWVPTVLWGSSTQTVWNEGYYSQPIRGKEISGSIVAEDLDWHGFNFLSYGNSKYRKLGWMDSSIAADRPGASQWGYQRMVGETMQIIVFDYLLDARTEELEPGVGGVKFVCPCTHRLSVFLSDPFPAVWVNTE